MYRALEGINAVVVGLMCGATLFLLKDVPFATLNIITVINIAVIAATFTMLTFTKVPAPIIVLVCLLLGWIF